MLGVEAIDEVDVELFEIASTRDSNLTKFSRDTTESEAANRSKIGVSNFRGK